MLSRIMVIISTLVLVPVVLHEFGTDRFAIWTVLSVVTTMLGPVDLGLGLGLVVLLSGEPDRHRGRAIASSAAALMALLGSALLLAWLGSEALGIDWLRVVGLPSGVLTRPERLLVVGSAVAGVALAMLTQVPARIHLATGEGHIGSWFTIAGQLAATIGAATWAMSGGGFSVFCLLIFVGPSAGGLLNYVFLAVRRADLLPRVSHASRSEFRPLFHVGAMFFVITMASAVALQSDSVVVSQALGPTEVTRFSLLARLFAVPPALLTFGVQTLLPEYSRLISNGNREATARLLRRVLTITATVAVVSSAVLVFTAPTVIRVWSGQSFHVSWLTLTTFAVWSCMLALGPVLGSFINAARAVRYQIVTTAAMAIVNVVLSVVLVRVIGLTGAVVGTIIAGTFCLYLPAVWWFRRWFQAAEQPGGQGRVEDNESSATEQPAAQPSIGREQGVEDVEDVAQQIVTDEGMR